MPSSVDPHRIQTEINTSAGKVEVNFIIEKEVVNEIRISDSDDLVTQYDDKTKNLLTAAMKVKEQGFFPDCGEKLDAILERCKYTFKAFDYQKENIETMLRRFEGKGVFGDQVGLGKTIQALLAALVLHEYKEVNKVLIIATPQTKDYWQNEAKKLMYYNEENKSFEESFDFITRDDNTLEDVFKKIQEEPASEDGKLKVFVATLEQLRQNKAGLLCRKSYLYDLISPEEEFSAAEKKAMNDGLTSTTPLANHLKNFGYRIPSKEENVDLWDQLREEAEALLRDPTKKELFERVQDPKDRYNIFDLLCGGEAHSDYASFLFFSKAQTGNKSENKPGELLPGLLNRMYRFLRWLEKDYWGTRLTDVRLREELSVQLAMGGFPSSVEKFRPWEQDAWIERFKQAGLYQDIVDLYYVHKDIEDKIQTAKELIEEDKNADPIQFQEGAIDLLIVDECDKILSGDPKTDANENADKKIQEKNRRKDIYDYLVKAQRKYTFLLSATPIKSNLEDIFTLLFLANPQKFVKDLHSGRNAEREAHEFFYKTICQIPNYVEGTEGHYLSQLALDPDSRQALIGAINTFFTRRRVQSLRDQMNGMKGGVDANGEKIEFDNAKAIRFLENNARTSCFEIEEKCEGKNEKNRFVVDSDFTSDGTSGSVLAEELLKYAGFHTQILPNANINLSNVSIWELVQVREGYNAAVTREMKRLGTHIASQKSTINPDWNISVLRENLDMSRHKKTGKALVFDNQAEDVDWKKVIETIKNDDIPNKYDDILFFSESTQNRGVKPEENPGNIYWAKKDDRAGLNLQDYGIFVFWPNRFSATEPTDLEQWIGRIYRTGQARYQCCVYVVLSRKKPDQNRIDGATEPLPVGSVSHSDEKGYASGDNSAYDSVDSTTESAFGDLADNATDSSMDNAAESSTDNAAVTRSGRKARQRSVDEEAAFELDQRYYELLADAEGLDLFGEGAPEVGFLAPIITDFLWSVIDESKPNEREKSWGKVEKTLGTQKYVFTPPPTKKIPLPPAEKRKSFAAVVSYFLASGFSVDGYKTIDEALLDVIRFFSALPEFRNGGN